MGIVPCHFPTLCENTLTQVLSHLGKVNSFFPTDQALTFITLKTVYLLSFVTPCLCLQYFHNNFLFLSKKSSPFDPVTDSLHTHGPTISPAAFFVLYNLLRTLGITAQTSQSLLGQTAWGFRCFFNLLGIQINNPVAKDLRQTSFARAWTVGKTLMICQTLENSMCV